MVFPAGFQWWHILEETVLTIPGHLVGVSSSDKHFILVVVGYRAGVPELSQHYQQFIRDLAQTQTLLDKPMENLTGLFHSVSRAQ